MAGKKPTPVKPASPSAKRSDSTASSPKNRPKQASKASDPGSMVRSPGKPRKNSKEKPAPAKKKRDKPNLEAGAKRKKQQESGEAGTPKKKGKKSDEPETIPQREATSVKSQQSPGISKKPASTPAKKQQQQKSGKLAAPAKKQQQKSGKSAAPAKQQQRSGKSATPAKKQQQSSGKAEKSAAGVATPTKKQQKEAKKEQQQTPGRAGKSTPTKRKRDNAESQKGVRSPKRASGEGETAVPTPVKKKQKDKKTAVADLGACSFPVARVRQLMRAEDDTIRASSEAVFLINKASELFLEKFAHDAYSNALKDRKKSIIYDNLSTAVCNQKGFNFLSDFVPQRLRAGDALKAAAAGPIVTRC